MWYNLDDFGEWDQDGEVDDVRQRVFETMVEIIEGLQECDGCCACAKFD